MNAWKLGTLCDAHQLVDSYSMKQFLECIRNYNLVKRVNIYTHSDKKTLSSSHAAAQRILPAAGGETEPELQCQQHQARPALRDRIGARWGFHSFLLPLTAPHTIDCAICDYALPVFPMVFQWLGLSQRVVSRQRKCSFTYAPEEVVTWKSRLLAWVHSMLTSS